MGKSSRNHLPKQNMMRFTLQKTEARQRPSVRLSVRHLSAYRRTFAVLLTSVMALLLLAGCPPNNSPPEPHRIDPNDIQPTRLEPNDIEPNMTEPNTADIKVTEPNAAEPNATEPNAAEPNAAEPNAAEPNATEPNVVEPNATEPNVTDSNLFEPNIAEPNTHPVALGPNEPNKTEPNAVKTRPKITFHNHCAVIMNKKLIRDTGLVNYQYLRWEIYNLGKLQGKFAKLPRSEYDNWPKEDKIAFWINAYNTQILDIIRANYPVKSSRWDRLWWPPTSIRHINKSIGGIKNQKFIIMDEEFTLSTIEDRFFFKDFNEPRVFFALSQASLDSPPLRNEPYYGHMLDKQLEDQVRRFLSSPRAFRIDRQKKIVHLSSIFRPDWYGKKFLDKYATEKKFKDHPATVRAVLNFITNYISERDTSFLETENYTVRYKNYDWRLNDTPKK